MSNPKVSVCMITYNQESFIAQAIESVLMQKTDFDYEIVIGEDCSTDHTREIVVDYQKKNPDKIKTLLHPYNLGPVNVPSKNNFIKTLNACKGKYIALLEGDDYWIDPFKLQRQVNFLNKHQSYSMCFHNAIIMEEDNLTDKKVLPVQVKSIYNTEDTLNPFNVFAPTASIVFRNYLITNMPRWTYKCTLGDRVLFTMLSKHGHIKYLDFVGSVRRIHSGGIVSTFTKESIFLNRIIFFKKMPSYIGTRYANLCKTYRKYFYHNLIWHYSLNRSEKNNRFISILFCFFYLFSWDFLSLLPVSGVSGMDNDKLFLRRVIKNCFRILFRNS